MIEAILQYVIALSSALTAAFVGYIARTAHGTLKTIEENEQRSTVNRKVLRREGMYVPLKERARSEGES